VYVKKPANLYAGLNPIAIASPRIFRAIFLSIKEKLFVVKKSHASCLFNINFKVSK